MDRFNEALVTREARRLSVGLASDPEERRAAQRLRWQVFAEELGAKIGRASCRERVCNDV